MIGGPRRTMTMFAARLRQRLLLMRSRMIDVAIIGRMAGLAIPAVSPIRYRIVNGAAMIWAALSIGLTVLLAVWTARPRRREDGLASPLRWLVLTDEPSRLPVISLPQAILVRPALPALAVAYPIWSASTQGWRAEKPLTPWFRRPAPYAVAAAFGAVSLDLSALGLGVPEIVASHLFDGQPATHEPASSGLGFEHWADADLSALFGSSHDAVFAPDSVAWDQSDVMTPAWQRPPELSHDWWA